MARCGRSIALQRDACHLLAGGVGSNFRLGMHPVPLFFERAEGARLFDADGNVHLDYALGMGPAILGHAPAAVAAALRLPWSTGPVEGLITKLKLVNRSVYGRAGLPLLRARLAGAA
jgi:glutamate-1-semialdehyde 2,1-aminomutase